MWRYGIKYSVDEVTIIVRENLGSAKLKRHLTFMLKISVLMKQAKMFVELGCPEEKDVNSPLWPRYLEFSTVCDWLISRGEECGLLGVKGMYWPLFVLFHVYLML